MENNRVLQDIFQWVLGEGSYSHVLCFNTILSIVRPSLPMYSWLDLLTLSVAAWGGQPLTLMVPGFSSRA